jgi:hypothetical protein
LNCIALATSESGSSPASFLSRIKIFPLICTGQKQKHKQVATCCRWFSPWIIPWLLSGLTPPNGKISSVAMHMFNLCGEWLIGVFQYVQSYGLKSEQLLEFRVLPHLIWERSETKTEMWFSPVKNAGGIRFWSHAWSSCAFKKWGELVLRGGLLVCWFGFGVWLRHPKNIHLNS